MPWTSAFVSSARPGRSWPPAAPATRGTSREASTTSSAVSPSASSTSRSSPGEAVSADALTSQGQAACAWASGRNVPWLFVVTHEALEPGVDATAALDGCGLAPMMPLTGMIAQRISPASRVPEGLDLTVPDEDRGVFGADRRELARLWHGSSTRASR